jgi:8-oxo-dGTP diphosphatase
MDVVAAAIVRDGQLLAARRSRPVALAGGWEFPGGKVESGEDGPAALVRECAEELGVVVRVGPRLGAAADGDIRIVLFGAALERGEPAALQDHDELRWLVPAAVRDVAWLPLDLQLLAAAHAYLLERIQPGW